MSFQLVFSAFNDLSETLVASLASALNASKIPCVLWGHYLLNVHGAPSIIGVFCHSESLIVNRYNCCSALPGLQPCPSPTTCPTSSQERRTPPPAFHVHINALEITIALYLQSETLWFLPLLDNSLVSLDQSQLPSYFALASNQDLLPPKRPGRGSGVFKYRKRPVVVPKSHVLLEAYLRLYARDYGRPVGALAMAMIGYMEEYVDDDGLLDASQLPEPLKTLYTKLHEGKKPVRQWTKELKHSLQIPE
ncbi:hypothetical protein LZ30DRAFT_753506 [Colletotrichum cereale]|nr:hypothetical protein LZ30DRAFT_753506 [Colletotrichum cereale]